VCVCVCVCACVRARVCVIALSSLSSYREPGKRVGMTGYGLDDREVGIRVPVGSLIFSSPRRPDRPWGPPSLLSNGYRGLVPRW
jgi:hypothetical protein